MPEHVGFPGQIGPKKLWDILSFDPRMYSSFAVAFSDNCPESIKRQIWRRDDHNLVIFLTFVCPAHQFQGSVVSSSLVYPTA